MDEKRQIEIALGEIKSLAKFHVSMNHYLRWSETPRVVYYIAKKTRAITERRARRALRTLVKAWLESRGLEDVKIRSGLQLWPSKPGRHLSDVLGSTSIFTTEDNHPYNPWDNSITVRPMVGGQLPVWLQGGKAVVSVMKHAATTDPRFLQPLGTEFRDFMQKLVDALEAENDTGSESV
jgi:hypothetical protein